MKLAALYSGGKDSTFAIYVAEMNGNDVPLLLSVFPHENSMLFHTPNIGMVRVEAECMRKELLTSNVEEDEEEPLFQLFEMAARRGCSGVLTGAILSDYQYSRIDRIAWECGLLSIAPLWRKDQALLLREIVNAGINAIVVSTSAEGLDSSWLGRSVDMQTVEELLKLRRRYGINVSGEGGEYETLVLDSPIHRERLEIVDAETIKIGKASKLEIKEIKRIRK
ncbi:MAG: diphthine--ammonia ligase [Methanomassiliicoccales archaeon]